VSSTNKVTEPELAIAKGQPVEVTVTSGPSRQPVADMTVSLRRDHHYSWLEGGEERSGVGGPQWWVATDDSGKATTHTLPGKLEVSIYSPRWRTEKSIEVMPNQPAKIELHREIDEKRAITGMIVPDEGLDIKLEDVEIRAASVDGNFRDEQTIKCTPYGVFSFDTYAAEVAIFASSSDGKAAGSTVTKKLAFPVELHATADYQGQLLGKGDEPIARHPVRAYIRLEGKRRYDLQYTDTFEVKRILPTQMNVTLIADALDGTDGGVSLGRVNLKTGESPLRAVNRLEN
jgi:hypothetical protein